MSTTGSDKPMKIQVLDPNGQVRRNLDDVCRLGGHPTMKQAFTTAIRWFAVCVRTMRAGGHIEVVTPQGEITRVVPSCLLDIDPNV